MHTFGKNALNARVIVRPGVILNETFIDGTSQSSESRPPEEYIPLSGSFTSVGKPIGGNKPYNYRHTRYPVDLVQTTLIETNGEQFVTRRERTTFSTVPSVIVLTPYETPDQSAEIRAKILGKLKTVDFDVGIALGEFRELANLLDKTTQRAIRAYKSLKAFDLAGCSHYLKYRLRPRVRRRLEKQIPFYRIRKDGPAAFAANAWLEYQYGWRLLLKDIYDAEAALDKRLDTVPVTTEVTARCKKKLKLVTVLDGPASGLGFKNTISSVDATFTHRMVIRYSVDSPFLRTLQSLGLTNPMSTAYNLTRLSFVVDWFLPIGNWLNQLDATIGLTFVSGSESIKSEVTTTCLWNSGSDSAGASSSSLKRTGPCWQEKYTKQRVPLSDFPAPQIFLQPKLDLARLLTSISLLTQTFSGK